MSKEQIEEAIMAFWDLPLRADGFQDGRPNQHAGHAELAKALAEHLATELPPTVDELLEAAVKLPVPAGQDRMPYIRIFHDGSGSVREDRENVITEATLAAWSSTDTPGKDAMATIEAAMKPEPSAREKALAALRDIEEAPCSLGPRIAIIREALEK